MTWAKANRVTMEEFIEFEAKYDGDEKTYKQDRWDTITPTATNTLHTNTIIKWINLWYRGKTTHENYRMKKSKNLKWI